MEADDIRNLRISCDVSELSRVREALKDFLGASFDRIDTNRIILSVDEALANIVEHSYEGKDGADAPPIDLRMERFPALVRFALEDRGPLFDPTRLPKPNLEEHAKNTNEGGLGVFLYMTLMDRATHEAREGGGNRLVLEKKVPTDQSPS
ncbi:MAG: ATP-binding protein [Leptospirales bacterium]